MQPDLAIRFRGMASGGTGNAPRLPACGSAGAPESQRLDAHDVAQGTDRLGQHLAEGLVDVSIGAIALPPGLSRPRLTVAMLDQSVPSAAPSGDARRGRNPDMLA